jgi:rRNA maturation protein Nop10
VKKNITTIVPSGSNMNSQDGSLMGLSTLDNCITVAGSETKNLKIPYKYSSSGPFRKSNKPNISAACVNIMSLNCETSYISEKNGVKLYPPPLETSYQSFTGTSISAAFISGVCALLYENNPNYTFSDICSILKLASDGDESLKSTHGEGTINIRKLLIK